MITMIQDKIKPMVVSSMLDHDSLHGNTSGKSIEVSKLHKTDILLHQFHIIDPFCPINGHYDHWVEFIDGG